MGVNYAWNVLTIFFFIFFFSITTSKNSIVKWQYAASFTIRGPNTIAVLRKFKWTMRYNLHFCLSSKRRWKIGRWFKAELRYLRWFLFGFSFLSLETEKNPLICDESKVVIEYFDWTELISTSSREYNFCGEKTHLYISIDCITWWFPITFPISISKRMMIHLVCNACDMWHITQ